MTIELANSS